jgi:hypothetical protein
MQTDGWTGFAFDWAGSQVYNNVFYNSTVMTGYNVSMWGNSYASGSPSVNVTVTYPSAVPSPVPMPVTGGAASGGSGSPSSSASSGSSSAAQSAAAPLSVGPRFPQKKGKSSVAAASGSSTTSISASAALAGASIQGTFRKQAGGVKSAASYALSASATLAGLGTFHLSGAGIGAVRLDTATGTVHLANAKGAVTLSLSALNVSATDPTPTSFKYVVTRATGPCKHLSAQTGVLKLTLTPGKKPSIGDFSLSLSAS